MAVQAQYPSSVLLLNRNVQESKNMLGNNDFSLQPQPGGGGGGGFLDQSHMIFINNGVGGNPRKRSREVAATQATATTTTTTTGVNMNSFGFSLQNHHQQQQQRHQQNQNQNHQLIDLSLLQNQPNVVSTGLGLSFGEQSQQHLQQQPQQIQQQIQQQPMLLSLLSEDLSLQLKQQSDELNYFLQSQAEHLRRTLAEKRRGHYRALLGAAEEAVARALREKDVEVEKAARRNAELEAQWAQLSAEAQSWRAQAQAQEAHAAALQAQIQQAHANANVMAGGALQQDREGAGPSCTGGGDAEDSESAYVDPVSERRVNSLSCKVCRKRFASVVLLPCRHLCVCTECDGVVSACPLCLSLRSASVEVFLT
ncbi:hypothetical protein Cgig2_020604 [Carnegiea gigantea]|uniref:RING-type domain-containing protein n=1 Tax=Carnegiea gigantea TaxID=171969 RepID=A0A9Q1Q8Q7_9CARY|nr:hypothetical protein Cgig2_020604 [Carnegiea gigantea]